MREKEIILKGIPASSGQAKGEVCVVLSETDFPKFKKGQILVTTMTNPIYTPLIAMAAAIITDLGGTLSHAAIVSREMGIPAVVGTKKATKILKNGDSIFIDGSEGFVLKELKRKSRSITQKNKEEFLDRNNSTYKRKKMF